MGTLFQNYRAKVVKTFDLCKFFFQYFNFFYFFRNYSPQIASFSAFLCVKKRAKTNK